MMKKKKNDNEEEQRLRAELYSEFWKAVYLMIKQKETRGDNKDVDSIRNIDAAGNICSN